jgi:predicted nucleic acid-binding protein
MKNKIRAVIDTNVIVSAVLLPRSVSRQIFDFVVLQGTLLASEQTLEELNEVLCRALLINTCLNKNG